MSNIQPMTIEDYEPVIALLQGSAGVVIREADSRAAIARYLARNPDLSCVASIDGEIVGCALCGHDGRRGYLHHLAVSESCRRRGIGTRLVTRCVAALGSLGILKIHIDILTTNAGAMAFWEKQGWHRRTDIHRLSFIRSDNTNV